MKTIILLRSLLYPSEPRRRRTALLVLALLVGAIVVAEADTTLPVKEQLARLGFQTPRGELAAADFRLRNLAGAETSLGSLRGRVVLLNFWATWCGPCRQEIPSMQRLYAELSDKGLEILAVNSMEERQHVQEFVRDSGLTFPVVLDRSGSVGAMYGVRGIPTTYLIDRRGRILARMVGTRDWHTPEMVALFNRVLAQ